MSVDSLLVSIQTGIVLQGQSTTELLVREASELLGLAVASATVAGLVALLYRWYVRERVPSGLSILFGLTVVALYLGTTTALGAVIIGDDDVLAAKAVLPNLAAFAAGGLGSYSGLKVGDRLGSDLFVATGGRNVDADVSEIVQTVGRVTSVKLPDEIGDIVGYDPMPEETKEKLGGRRFLFPRRLTKAELRDRLVSRLKTDYGVGHVDVELADDGSVEFLAIGSRAAGIGPTLPPATSAVAIQADPAHAASAGDLVQVWETDPLQRVLTGELRGIAGEVVTVAIDTADTPKLEPTKRYKLITLPVQDRPDREFASLLRAADETMGTVTVERGSHLDGTTVGSLAVTVAAITREDGPPETIPDRDRVLSADDVLYVIATPDALRRIEDDAEGSPVDGDAEDVTSAVESETGTVEAASKEESATESTVASDQPTEEPPETTDQEPGDGSERELAQSEDSSSVADSADPANERPDGDEDVTIPDTDAFPDSDDLPGFSTEEDGDPDEELPEEQTTTAESTDEATADGDSTAAEPPIDFDETTDEADGEANDDLDGAPEARLDDDATVEQSDNSDLGESADDIFDSLPGEETDNDADLDDLLTAEDDEDLTVWDPDERLGEDDTDEEAIDAESDEDDETRQ